MRLTQKANKENEHLKMCIGWYELPTRDYHVRVINETPNKMYQKLGQLEDIEEELGIDILIFAKLVVYGCYVKDEWEGGISQFNFSGLVSDGFFAKYGQNYDNHYFAFKDYGKTWALTKEELEND